jgi:hypothetical protein
MIEALELLLLGLLEGGQELVHRLLSLPQFSAYHSQRIQRLCISEMNRGWEDVIFGLAVFYMVINNPPP